MFLGIYKSYFTGKNRLVLPKKFRKELGKEDAFYLVLGEDGEIWGFDRQNWMNLAENILKLPLSTREGRRSRLDLFSRSEECSLDQQGRFILPQEFIEKSHLTDEVYVLGAGDHFEIWNPTLFSESGNMNGKGAVR